MNSESGLIISPEVSSGDTYKSIICVL